MMRHFRNRRRGHFLPVDVPGAGTGTSGPMTPVAIRTMRGSSHPCLAGSATAGGYGAGELASDPERAGSPAS